MIHFPNKTLERYTLTDTITDTYGATIPAYEYSNDIIVDFQNETNKEVRETYGVEKDNLYRAYIDINDELSDSDELRDKTGNKYEIIGEIQEYNHFHDYKIAHLIRKRRGG